MELVGYDAPLAVLRILYTNIADHPTRIRLFKLLSRTHPRQLVTEAAPFHFTQMSIAYPEVFNMWDFLIRQDNSLVEYITEQEVRQNFFTLEGTFNSPWCGVLNLVAQHRPDFIIQLPGNLSLVKESLVDALELEDLNVRITRVAQTISTLRMIRLRGVDFMPTSRRESEFW